ncbi:MAG: glycosyltransferase [Bacteroidia bacterium]|nr:glycosyltransferase [Bacteroidia bacterium]
MKGHHFIFTGLQSWDIPIGSNAIDIAKEIAKQNKVLYVNSPLDLMTLYRNEGKSETKNRLEVLKKKKHPVRKISENLSVLDFTFPILSVNGLPDGPLFDIVNNFNNRRIYKFIAQWAKNLGFENYIHFIDNDIYRSFYSKDFLKPKLSVYYRRDNLHPMNYWKKHVPRLEPLLIAKSDLVVANSPQLADFAKQFNPKSFNVGQGVDLSAYNPDMEGNGPIELSKFTRPLIGYIGDINSMRLDANLIYELAKSKPNYSFIMIGGEDAVFKSHTLHQLPNVHFLGSIPKNRVPEFIHGMDVCMNPQLINEITIGNYPRKVDEYIAMGKPVLATHTQTMELFKNHVYLCSNVEDYQHAIEKAILDKSEEARIERIRFARSHSWESNVAEIYSRILEHLN